MARILVIVPFALDADGVANREKQQKYVQLDPDTELTYRPVTAGPTSFMSPHDWTLMDLAIFEAGLSAEADGFDAVCIDTMSNSGMAPLRSVLNIPVISPGKASMLYAQTLGSTFSILAQWEPALPATGKPSGNMVLRNNAHRCVHSISRRTSHRCSTARKTKSFLGCSRRQSVASRTTGRKYLYRRSTRRCIRRRNSSQRNCRCLSSIRDPLLL